MGCTSKFPAGRYIFTFTSVDSNGAPGAADTLTMSDNTNGGLNAFSVQIRFQSTDFQSTTTAVRHQVPA